MIVDLISLVCDWRSTFCAIFRDVREDKNNYLLQKTWIWIWHIKDDLTFIKVLKFKEITRSVSRETT